MSDIITLSSDDDKESSRELAPINSQFPWSNEPDKEVFEHHGVLCCVRLFEQLGYYTAYIAVPCDCPVDVDKLSVHGGVSFDQQSRKGVRIIGFDAGHACDLSRPQYMRIQQLGEPVDAYAEYRTFQYMKDQVMGMADQVHKAITDQQYFLIKLPSEVME